MKKAYQNTFAHKDRNKVEKGECADSMNLDAYSEELEIGKKKVRITLEFPYTVDPKDADRFEHMLKEVYMNKIQKGSLRNSQGGMNHE